MKVSLVPGTRVILDDPEYGDWHGRLVVCLCKRHVWQQQVGEGGPGRECGHARCGFSPAADACPWPLHVVWDSHWSDTDGPNESHQGPDSLRLELPPAE
ncbi:hypothetical protein ACLGIH_20500 [Streptomyces sp. HMX87]|uniref:hypothetical protein n=1 Tax=Streptomyces sp. HMX87 TaxID=3390849 RepID=UPI003A8B5908